MQFAVYLEDTYVCRILRIVCICKLYDKKWPRKDAIPCLRMGGQGMGVLQGHVTVT